MSTIDRAFVKAYARRQQSGGKPSPAAVSQQSPDDIVLINEGAADTASVWLDNGNDSTLRVDSAHSMHVRLPTPAAPTKGPSAAPSTTLEKSNNTTSNPVADLQQIYTAFAVIADHASWTADVFTTEVDTHNKYGSALLQRDAEMHRAAEQCASEKLAAEKLAAEKLAAEKLAAEKLAAEKLAAEKLAAEKLAAEKLAAESTSGVEERPAADHFRAKWEIDALDVPSAVADLFFDGELFQQIAEQLSGAVATGLKRLLVTSVQDGEGRSTAAIGLAIAAAASGLRVALVDGDVTAPTLVDDLRLELEFGWIEALRGRLPIEEVSVHATQDGVTLVPLMTPSEGASATAREIDLLLDKLENEFELIIVDGGCSKCKTTRLTLGQYDSAMILFDKTRTATADINEYSYQLRSAGVLGVGVIENFVN